jgi:hypothetical protein
MPSWTLVKHFTGGVEEAESGDIYGIAVFRYVGCHGSLARKQ